MNILKSRTALVTGATGGLGREVVFELSEAGCKVIAVGRDKEKLSKLQSQVAGVVSVATADLTDVGGMFDIAHRVGVGADILINCAGVSAHIASSDLSHSDYRYMMELNVGAPFYLSVGIGDAMAGRGWGRIVNIGSSSSYAGFANSAVYCASKHAILGLSRSMHAEYKDRGVRVYCVSPGTMQTDMGKTVPNQDCESFMNPLEVAKYIVFIIGFDGNLVSPEIRLDRMQIK